MSWTLPRRACNFGVIVGGVVGTEDPERVPSVRHVRQRPVQNSLRLSTGALISLFLPTETRGTGNQPGRGAFLAVREMLQSLYVGIQGEERYCSSALEASCGKDPQTEGNRERPRGRRESSHRLTTR